MCIELFQGKPSRNLPTWKQHPASSLALYLSLLHQHHPFSISCSDLKLSTCVFVCAQCVHGTLKKGSQAIRWQLFHIWRMDILRALSQRQKASSHKRPTWSELCALGLSYSFTLLALPLHPLPLWKREKARERRISIRRPKFHMWCKGIYLDPLPSHNIFLSLFSDIFTLRPEYSRVRPSISFLYYSNIFLVEQN